MGISVFSYSAVITKLRAMSAGILTKQQYEILMAKPRVGDILHWLREESDYSNVLADLSETNIHRGMLEHEFQMMLLHDANKLSHMLREHETRVLHALFERVKIQILKQIVRAVLLGETIQEDAAYRAYKSKIWLSPSQSFQVKSLPELAETLKGTGYYKVLEPFCYSQPENPFELECALDQYYFTELRGIILRELSGKDRQDTFEFVSTEIDLYNILWAYRYKKYYSFTEEEYKRFLIPNKFKLKKEMLDQLIRADSRDFERIVAETKYRRVFAGGNDKEWDHRVSVSLYQLYAKKLNSNSYSFATILSYFFLRELDIRNIITIIEGVRYALEPSAIRQYLIY